MAFLHQVTSFHKVIFFALFCASSTILFGCNSKPKQARFSIQIQVKNQEGQAIPNARILLNGKWVGISSQSGFFKTGYQGKTGKKVTIRAEGPDGKSFFQARYPLLMRKSPKHGWKPKSLYIQATLATQLRKQAISEQKTETKEIIMIDEQAEERKQLDAEKEKKRLEAEKERLEQKKLAQKEKKPKKEKKSKKEEKQTAKRIKTNNKTRGGKGRRLACFRSQRGPYRLVIISLTLGTSLRIKGECGQKLSNIKKSSLRLELPIGTYQRLEARLGSSKKEKVFEVSEGRRAIKINLRLSPTSTSEENNTSCNLKSLARRVSRRGTLSASQVKCVQKARIINATAFTASITLAKHYANKRNCSGAIKILNPLYSNPKNRFMVFRAMQIGMTYGKCRRYGKGIRFLRYAERALPRLSGSSRHKNTKAVYRALSILYEQGFYRSKKKNWLVQSLKYMQRNLGLQRSSTGKTKARRELTRLQKLAIKYGVLDED